MTLPATFSLASLPFGRPDRRTRHVRRAERYAAELTASFGGPLSVVQVSLIRKVAELTIAAESLRARILAGETSFDAYELAVKIEGEARRTLAALGIETRPQAKRVPTVDDYLAGLTAKRDQRPPQAECGAGNPQATPDAENAPTSPAAHSFGVP
jgi:hypothetical protein